jgi:choline dehydrogenase/4-pyridoxate dehydrogenase
VGRARLPGWSHADLLPFFKRSERWEDGDDAWRGGTGPIVARRSRYADPLVEAWIAAARSLGLPWTDDYNGARRVGVARLQSAIRDGRRCSGADAYLRPALGRPNLVVRTGVRAVRIAIEGGRAIGVETIGGRDSGSERNRACWLADREVLVCAGAFDSPKLLMLSGIGDADALRALGVAPRVALPGVGRDLQDHPALSVAFARRAPGPMHRRLRADRAAWMLAQAWIAGRGFATDLPSGWVAFVRTPHAGPAPDLQLLFNAGTLAARPWLPPFVAPYADGFACAPWRSPRPAAGA